MAKLGNQLSGIPAIYRANAVDLMVFGAIYHHRIENPNTEVKETIKLVARNFSIPETQINSLEVGYYRTLRAYKDNGGV